MVKYPDPHGLNPEPTDVQLFLFRLHKKNGTTPGNPKWYRDPGARFRRGRRRRTGFGPPRYPRYQTGADSRMDRRYSEDFAPDAFQRAAGKSLLQYIAAFEKAKGLMPILYPWDKSK